MMSAGNIPYCSSQSRVFVTIYTTKQGHKAIASANVFKQLKKYANVSFNYMPISKIKIMAPLQVMNICQRHALQNGFSRKRIMLPFTADVFLTENLLKTGIQKIQAGYQMVVGTGLRINEDPVMKAANKNKNVVFCIKNKTAVEWAKKHRHIFTKRQNVFGKRFIYSAELYSENSNILISRCFGLAPFMLFPEKLSTLPNITFDDSFIDKIFPNRNKISVLTNLLNDGGIYSVTKKTSLSSLSLCSKDGYSPLIYGKKIFSFVKSGHLGHTHLFYFNHLIIYGKPTTRQDHELIKSFHLQADLISKYLNLKLKLHHLGLNNCFELIQSIKNFIFDKEIFPEAYECLPSFYKRSFIEKYIALYHPLCWRKSKKIQLQKQRQKMYGVSRINVILKQISVLTEIFFRPLFFNMLFLSHCILNPHKIGGLINAYDCTEKKCFSISLLKKMRNASWPFVIFFLSNLGSSVTKLKIFFLKSFGLRGGKGCRIHRGVYFKNPWNVILRPFCEIGLETVIDAPSEVIECGFYSRISTRCILSSIRATPLNLGGPDAINSRIVIPAYSVLDIGTIAAPPKR